MLIFLQTAQQLSQVKLDGYERNSYAGFLTVNSTYDSNLFFWFFPAEVRNIIACVVILFTITFISSTLLPFYNL